MIQVENVFMDEFTGLDPVAGHNPLFYHFGEQKELNAVIQTRQENQTYTYPILWYLMPNEVTVTNLWAEGDFEFVLAHNTNLDWFNDQRFKNVFNAILQPNFEIFLSAIARSKRIERLKLSNGNEYSYLNYPNYGNPTTFEGKSEAKQLNYWDAMKATLKLRIHKEHNC